MGNVNDKSPTFKEMNYKLAQKAIMNYFLKKGEKKERKKSKKVIKKLSIKK